MTAEGAQPVPEMAGALSGCQAAAALPVPELAGAPESVQLASVADQLACTSVDRAASAKRLARGRLLTFFAILILSFDTPTYRLVHTATPLEEQVALGLAINIWRGCAYCLASAIALRYESRTWAELAAAVRLLGWKRLLFGALTLAGSGVSFSVAVALTTATNVLVIIAMMPLACALSGQALGVRLPRHTWIASAFGACSVALVFATGIKAGPEQTRGCLLALCAMGCFAGFVTMGSHAGHTSCVASMPLAGVFMVSISLAALGSKAHYAAPISRSDGVMLTVNALTNAVSNAMLAMGTQSVPAAEVSLIGLLETALSPVLVYLVTIKQPHPEIPDSKSIVAGVLIIATLAGHTLWDARLARRERAVTAAGDAAAAEGG